MASRKDVAVIGPLRAGKDSIAHELVWNAGYKKFALADCLKDEVVTALDAVEGGWTRERLEAEKTSLRTLLQVWGTEFRRAQDKGYWVRKLETKLIAHEQQALKDSYAPAPCIVTDARFTNELDMLVDRGFIIVRLKMPANVLRDHLHKVAQMSDEQIDLALAHPSENEWRSYPVSAEFDSVPGGVAGLIAEVKDFVLNG